MSTSEGLKRRLKAALKALKGEYVMVEGVRPRGVVPKGSIPIIEQGGRITYALVDIDVKKKNISADDRTINILKNDYCTGCGACYNACPKKAITMEKNEEGFLAPVIDEEKCVNCGLCQKSCPAINYKSGNQNNKKPDCMAVMADDETRKVSSSGGFFSVIAEYVLNQGGYVCGAAYDKNNEFYVHHIIINKKEDLDLLRGSKYVQSDTELVFQDIRKILNKGSKLLFCGTPCQVAGLKRFLGKDYDNLITCDLVCHGVPSYEAFNKYLHANYDLKNIADFKFRQKESKYDCTTALVNFKDGKKEFRTIRTDKYEKMFHSGNMFRECCYDCKYADLPRYGDFTIGDFWGVSKINKEYNDQKGTSLVLVNNSKADAIYNELKDKFILSEKADLDIALANNSFAARRKYPKSRKRFYKLLHLPKYNFNKAADYTKENRYDVGIVGLWYGRNYGSMATYFALHQILEKKFGLSVLMIENPLGGEEKDDIPPRRVAKQFYAISDVYNVDNIRLLNEVCDTFVVGSDQLWNVGLSRPYGQIYYLGFVNDSHKKISYATSFGGEYRGSNEERKISSDNLKKFSHVSVRDRLSKRIASETFGVPNVVENCDPALLCTADMYQPLIDKVGYKSVTQMLLKMKSDDEKAVERLNKQDDSYILAYILDPTFEVGEQLEKLCKEKQKKVIVIFDEPPWLWQENFEKLSINLEENPDIYILKNVSLYRWMWLYKNADCVVTDSYHGTIFSIVFRKPFITKINNKRGGERFTSLLEPIDLCNRLIDDINQLEQRYNDLDSLDYTEPVKKLDKIRNNSINWLENALFDNKNSKKDQAKKEEKPLVSGGEITVKALRPDYCCGCGACFNSCPVDAIKMEQDKAGFFKPVIDSEKCIKCGKCKNVCPVINNKKENNKNPSCYAVMAEDNIRTQSSSGGAFTLIANYVFEQGGYVCGVVLNKDFMPEHIITNNPKDLEKMRGSKYVQSNTGDCFSQIKKLLEDNKLVLFTGTPCQVAGLRGYLNKKYDNLICVDVVCHGSPSQKMFSKYIDDNFGKENLSEFNFRTKEFGYNCLTSVAYTKDGKKYANNIEFDSFEKTMHTSLGLQNICGDCLFASAPRQGDLTFGDFWGLAGYNKSYIDNKGTSCVLVNTETGEKIFSQIRNKMKLSEPVPFDFARKHNRFGQKMRLPSEKSRKWFFELLDYQPYNKLVDYSLNGKYDVCLVGLWYGRNYGSMVTYFALHQVLRKKFHLSVLMLENCLRPDSEDITEKTHPQKIAERYYDISPRYSLNELSVLNQQCDTFMVGADQLWNMDVSRHYKSTYYLGFADDTKKKISYGTSFGKEYKGNSYEKIMQKHYFENFDHISVRDEISEKILSDEFGINSVDMVCDPTFLCPVEEYKELSSHAEINETEPFILAHILDPFADGSTADIIEQISVEKGKKIIVILDADPNNIELHRNCFKLKGKGNVEIIDNVDLYQWMWYFLNAQSVVTDSYYGTIFSIIFKKPFITRINRLRGGNGFLSLLTPLGLLDRVVENFDGFLRNVNLLDSSDYTKVYESLDKIKNNSMEWLGNALFGTKKVKNKTIFPSIDNRIDDNNKKE